MHDATQLRKKILLSAYSQGIENNTDLIHERLHLKKQTVEYVLEKLKNEGYFTKTKYDLDLQTLGVGQFAWVFIGIDWQKYNQEKFIKEILDLTPVLTVADVTGTSDIAIKIFGPSVSYLGAFVLGMEKLFHGTITDVRIYYSNKEYKRHYLKIYKPVAQKINKIDCAILKEKTQDSKIGLMEIADKYGFHRNSVSKRWKGLWEKGIIVKEIPDLTQKGYDEIKMGLKAFMIIKPLPGCEGKLISTLVKRPDVQDVFTTLQNEIVIIIRTENSATLVQNHRSLTKVDCSVRRTNTSIFLTKYNKTTLSLKEMNSILNKRGN